jgi:ribosome-associated protein
MSITNKEIISIIKSAALEKKAEDVVVLGVDKKSNIADFFVICEGDNIIHNIAIKDYIVEKLEERNILPWHIEGEQEGRWILIDYSNIVVHVMIPEVRNYYALEELWKPINNLEKK